MGLLGVDRPSNLGHGPDFASAGCDEHVARMARLTRRTARHTGRRGPSLRPGASMSESSPPDRASAKPGVPNRAASNSGPRSRSDSFAWPRLLMVLRCPVGVAARRSSAATSRRYDPPGRDREVRRRRVSSFGRRCSWFCAVRSVSPPADPSRPHPAATTHQAAALIRSAAHAQAGPARLPYSHPAHRQTEVPPPGRPPESEPTTEVRQFSLVGSHPRGRS